MSSNEYNKNNKKLKNSWFISNPIQNIVKKSSKLTNKSRKNVVRNKKKIEENPQLTGNDELYFLSNANLNIINILNTCISDGFYKDTSFINNAKEKIRENVTQKWKNPMKAEKGKNIEQNIELKNIMKTNICSNKRKISKDFIINNNKNNVFFTSIGNDSLSHSKKSTQVQSDEKVSKRKSKGYLEKNKNKFVSHISSQKEINKKARINSNKKRSKSNKKLYNYKIDNFLNKIPSTNNKNMKESIFGQLRENQLYAINENINQEVNYIQLKKKLSLLKKRIEYNTPKISKKNIVVLHPLGDSSISNESNDINNKNEENKYKPNLIKKISSKPNIKNENDPSRYLKRKVNLYDSIDDEEYNDELIDYYITPDSLFLKIFDIILLFSSMFYFVIIPYFLSTNFIILKENKTCRIILILIDIIYIIDLIINFFRAYQTYDEHLIRRTRKIFKHYIKTWFLCDFIQAIPYFSIFLFLGKNTNENNEINAMYYILLMIKIIKTYKMINDNSTITYISGILTKNETIDDHGGMIISTLLTIFVLNLTTCLFIFIGFNSYPNWIFKLNIQDNSYIDIYLTSVYFIIVTITTVGYGDITGDSMPEILFQILLLIIGTIAYSFIISYISNYIIKINKKSMTYEKNVEILREIKLHHPNMKECLYQEVLRSLHNEQLYERKDKHLLFDSLPYNLKNELIMEMYKPLIQNFIFFKEVYNSSFIIKVATSLKSLISIKGDILINEGDFIKEIIFVKSGVIGLNICIDLDNPKNSIKKYLGKNEIGRFDIRYSKLSIINKRKNRKNIIETNLESLLKSKKEDSDDSNNESDNKGENIEDIKILEIRKNEHFGDALMFLNERCPLVAKVRTRNAELLILRKIEAIEIYSIYPNIWKRINKKSLYNMEQIYLKIKQKVEDFSSRYNIRFRKKNLKINKSFFNKNKKKVLFSSENDNNDNRNKDKDKNKDARENNENTDINKTIDEDNKKEKNKKDKNKNKKINDDIIPRKNIINEKESKIQKLSINLLNNKEEKKINKNDNTTISIVKNDSFLIIKNSEKTVDKYNNNSNNFDINKKESFTIKCRTFTIKKESKESIKANESYEELNDSFNIKNKKTKNLSIPKKEDIFYNAFINLDSTKENSFNLDSSYENINMISNNKYINDILLQNKIKEFIIKECSNNNYLFINEPKYLHSPTHNQDIKSINSRLIVNANTEENLKYNKSLTKKFFNNKSKTIAKTDKVNITRRNSVALVSPNKLDKKISQYNFGRNSVRLRSNFYSPRKTKRKLSKKKLIKVNKKLNTITKNIENTNNAINNPNEFYSNFFNNILNKQKSFDVMKTFDDSKKEKEKEK